MEKDLSLIVIIVNNGFSDDAINICKELGAKGATIVNASGSVRPDAEKLYGITINPEKEIVLVTISKSITDSILKEIYEKLGTTSKAQGVAFSLPISFATTNLYNQYITKKD